MSQTSRADDRRAAVSEQEALLRDSEARIALIVNTSTKSIFTIDERGIIEFANPAALSAFGYTQEELIGQNVKLLMPEPHRSQHDNILERYLRTGERSVIGIGREVIARRKDGSTFPVYVSAGEGWLGDKRIFTGIVEDLTRQKEAEAEVRRTAELLRAVADGTTDAVFVKDREGKYLWFNEAAARFVGRPVAEVIGKDDTALFDPESARVLMEWDRGVMEQGTVRTHEEHLTAAGVARVYTSTKAPYRDSGGNIIGLIGISRDITDQKRAEARIVKLNQELLRMVAELETLFEVIPIGIGVSEDAGCAAIKMNPALAKLFRMPIDANPSKHAVDVSASEHFTLCRDGREIPREELPFLTVTRTGKPSTNVEMQIVYNDGSSRFVMTNAAPLFDEAGQPRGAIGVFWDATDFKATAQLRAEKEAAESANKAKDEFLATISHELRTPISAILIWANLLKSANLSDENRRAGLDIIFQCAKDQSQLVNDLLDASRLLYGKVRAEMAPLDMIALIRATVDALRPTAEAKGVELQSSLSDVTLMGDALLLKQAIGNLLTNAIKFTPGGGKVAIRLRRCDDEAILQIEDDGEGISPEFLPHLFNSFRQADSSSIRRHGGLGLGLSIVKHLVELHGGTVRAASAGVGQGASFTMSLPLGLAGGLDRSRQMTGMFDALHAPMPALEGVRVLIVEDDAGTRNSLAVLLATLGAKVNAATSVAEAWAVLRTEKPDVLISDIAMPGEDGYALIRRLRASEAAGCAKIPAIALTACASDDDRSKSLASGFDVYLAKPIDPEELIRAVASVVKCRRGAHDGGDAPAVITSSSAK